MDITSYLTGPLYTIHYIILAVTAILHIIFAGAVAKDAGFLEKQGMKLFLVSGMTWSFATLIGGIFTAAIYWLIHRSTLNRGV